MATKITPQAFAKSHRQLVEQAVAPVAKQLKAKTLNTKLEAGLFEQRTTPEVKVVLDNIKVIGDASTRALPLKALYETSETMALEAAEAAAQSTDGVLNEKSARFLPNEYQADFEKITGATITDKPGAAVKGVSIKVNGADATVKINFRQALEGQTAQKVVLGLTQNVAIIAEKVDPPANPNLPAYWVYISPREGKMPGSVDLRNDSGIRGFNDPDQGNLIGAGTEQLQLLRSGTDRVVGKMTFTLDEVNDIGTRQKPASEKTKAVREAWISKFSENDGFFDFTKGLKNGSLTKVTRDEVEALQGSKTMLSAIRSDANLSITRLLTDERLELVRDPKTKSVAALLSADGESESWLYVLDEKAKKWVGTWSIGDDGTKGWSER